jgi:hypothetical protein
VVPGGHNLATGYSDEVQRAHYAGDLPRLLSAAEAALTLPGAEWDLQARCMCAWVRLLRDDEESCADPDEVDEVLAAGRRSGFYRLQWNALAHGAFCRALQGRHADAEDLLAELAKSWRDVRAIASGEWIDAAAHAAWLSGRGAAIIVRDMLANVPHHTPWVEAALRTVTGAAAFADGDFARAADLHLAAAEIYGQIPNLTDRALAVAATVRAMRRGAEGDDDALEPWRGELFAFAARAETPRLITLTE